MSEFELDFDCQLAFEEDHTASFSDNPFDLPPVDTWNLSAESSATTGSITPLLPESQSPPGKLSASSSTSPKPLLRLKTKSSWSPEKSGYVESSFAAPSSEPVATVEPAELTVEWWEFLVLDDPSRMGKTMFVMSFFGKHRTLEVHCAG